MKKTFATLTAGKKRKREAAPEVLPEPKPSLGGQPETTAGVPLFARSSSVKAAASAGVPVQRDGESGLPPVPNFRLTPPSILQPHQPGLLPSSEYQFRLSPEVMALVRAQAMERVLQLLNPERIRAALAQISPAAAGPIAPGAPSPSPSPTATTPAAAAPTATPSVPSPTPPLVLPGPSTVGVGVVWAMITADPSINRLATNAQSEAFNQLGRLSTAERVGTIAVTATMVLGSVGVLASDPRYRGPMLDTAFSLINGSVIPIPGTPASLELNWQPGRLVLGLHFDLGSVLPAPWGFSSIGFLSPNPMAAPPPPLPPLERSAEPGANDLPPPLLGFEQLGRRILAASSGGSGLSDDVRERLEEHLGVDLSDVKLHTDSEADQLARSVSAVAFTTGQNIFLRAGAYNPDSPEGMRLLAHEVVHTQQQAAGPVAGTPTPGGVAVSHPSDSFEREADSVAGQILQRRNGQSLRGRETEKNQRHAEKHQADGSGRMSARPDTPAPEGPSDGNASRKRPVQKRQKAGGKNAGRQSGTGSLPSLQRVPDDQQLVSFLNSQSGIDGVYFLGPLNGLRGFEQTHPQSFEVVRRRIIERHGRAAYDWLYANDARILNLVRNAEALRERTNELYDRYMETQQEVAAETIWDIARRYDFSYAKAVEGYRQAGEMALPIWEGFLAGDVIDVARGLQRQAESAQESAEERARLFEQRAEIGRGAIGTTVATREVLWWRDDTVRLQSLLPPEDGTEQQAEALARARMSGVATATLLRQQRYYVYQLSPQLSYSGIWETPDFEEHRTRIVPVGGAALALTTSEGYVIRPSGERFFGGDQSRHASSYLAGDTRVLEQQGSRLTNDQAMRLFRQMALDVVIANLSGAEQRLNEALGRLYPDMMLSPRAGADLQANTSTLRRHMMAAAALAARMGEEPTPADISEAQEILTAIGRIVSQDPTAAMMVTNHRETGATGPPEPGDIEDRLAGQMSGDAALTAAGEIRRRLENINTIRRYLYSHPDEVLAFSQLHAPILEQFSPDQQLYIRASVLLHDVGEVAARMGLLALDMMILIFGLVSGGLPALAAWGLGAGLGVVHTASAYEDARRLTAMSAVDFPGGFQLASPEQAASARNWAYVGVALTVLDVGGFIHSANQMSRLRRVLASPDLRAVVSNTERSLGEIAQQLGMSERQLVRALESSRGAARGDLLVRIREAANVGRLGARAAVERVGPVLEQWGGRSAEEVEALRLELMARQDVGRVQARLLEMGVEVDRSLLATAKRYSFDNPAIDFSYEYYNRWNRLAAGRGSIDDARHFVHEMAEVRRLQQVQQRTGFDFLGRNWEQMTTSQRRRWLADFERYYLPAHQAALESEYSFIAREVGAATNNRTRITRAVAAAVDPMRAEGREFMLVDGVLLRDHRQFYQWQQRARETVSIGRPARVRLNLPLERDITLEELVRAVKGYRP